MSVINSDLYDELVLLHERICRAIGDPKRLLIMYALHQGPRYVVELADELGIPQPTVSRHLSALHQGGLVEKERQGQTVYYRLSDERIIDALDKMRTILRDKLAASARVVSLTQPDNEEK
ncbi:MAG: winged helix-turn-helix transcriptional regulator [Chloroflexi bacterium]|nr:winged helix-turn-helix transcriptional regulator [Chloroflexota bacterium]